MPLQKSLTTSLPITIISCFIISRFSRKSSLFFLCLASLYFYGSWNPKYLILLLGSILFNYLTGYAIRKTESRSITTFGVITNILLLGYFKYTDFGIDCVNNLFHQSFPMQNIILPLAISFFTFQQIAWLVDSYKHEAPSCDFFEYFCAVSFFPHLIAGPIVQYHDLIPQLQSERTFKPDWSNINNALFLIAIGTFKKIVIADTLAFFATLYFDKTVHLSTGQAWVGLFSYTMQIYFDFSGYCDIALGSALLIGIKLPLNFDNPYRSVSIRDFWRRWHITLGYFFTKYVYIPLGGNRKGMLRTSVNIFLVMFLSGIWHGAGFGFIIWGCMHGIGMVVNRIFNYMGYKIPFRRLSILTTFLYISFAWVFFRSSSVSRALDFFTALFSWDFSGLSFSMCIADIRSYLNLSMREFQHLLRIMPLALLLVIFSPRAQVIYDKFIRSGKVLSYILLYGSGILFIYSLYKMLSVPYTEFIYFNF